MLYCFIWLYNSVEIVKAYYKKYFGAEQSKSTSDKMLFAIACKQMKP